MKEKLDYEWGDGVFTLLSWFKKEKVKGAKVLVAGAGALGNEVVKNLALFGVGHIYICDYDKIEISNLTRSVLFREEDAIKHSYKAEIIAKRAKEINPQINIYPIVGNLFSDIGLGLYNAVDVIIGCLDSRIARYQLNRLALRAGKIWIDGSIENLIGVVRVYAPGISCYECSLSREEFNYIMLRTGCADVVRVQSKAGRVATTPIGASIVGAIQVQEAMKVIHTEYGQQTPFKTLIGKIWRFDGMTNTVSTYKQSSWKNTCPSHEKWDNIIKSKNLSANMTVLEVINSLKKITGATFVEINMRNNRFVEKIIADQPEKEFEIRIPESKLDDYIAHNDEMRKLSYRSLFHKSFIENINETFPFMDMYLKDIGIPYFDVIQVTTNKGLFYIELSGDAHIYGL